MLAEVQGFYFSLILSFLKLVSEPNYVATVEMIADEVIAKNASDRSFLRLKL